MSEEDYQSPGESDLLAFYILLGMVGGYWFLVFIIMVFKNCSCFQIHEREVSVKERCGKKGQQLGPGWYCLCPLLDRRREYEYRYYITNGHNNIMKEIKGRQLIIPQ